MTWIQRFVCGSVIGAASLIAGAAGLTGKVKILVGGAPVTQAWADEIGADGYSENAVGAVALAKKAVAAAYDDGLRGRRKLPGSGAGVQRLADQCDA